MAGLYIHIPFCESRCIYCGFYSTTSLSQRDDYVDALCREMQMRPTSLALGTEETIQTIYLGGGTPSQLNRQQLIRLFSAIQANYDIAQTDGTHKPEIEITMECNPDDVTEEFCKTLRLLPVNRISMGAQTFSDDRLRFLRRRHHAAEVKQAIKRLRAIGINNISIDLMFGFPEETLTEWKEDIAEALSLGVEHISAYSLMYEEGTSLYRLLEQGKIKEIDEELSRNMYDTLVKELTSAGFEHYEISNFARPGFRSKHNSSYWHETPYIGLGAAAHSYARIPQANNSLKVIRSWNISNLQEYIHNIRKGILPSDQEVLDLDTRYNDLMTTALRTSDGVDLDKLRKEFGEQRLHDTLHEAEHKIKRGLMKIANGRLSLTPTGFFISDDIMSDFMIV